MIAIINLPNQEGIVDALEDKIYNNIKDNDAMGKYLSKLHEMILKGITEEAAWEYVNEWIGEYNGR